MEHTLDCHYFLLICSYNFLFVVILSNYFSDKIQPEPEIENKREKYHLEKMTHEIRWKYLLEDMCTINDLISPLRT